MKIGTCLLITLLPYTLLGQDIIGIEIDQRDLLIKGKINVSDEYQNTIVGYHLDVVDSINIGGHRNTYVGYQAGDSTIVGSDNTYLGYRAGYGNPASSSANVFIGRLTGYGGYANTFVGSGAGYGAGLTSGIRRNGNHNVFIGHESGFLNQGDDNIFLGDLSGAFNEGSNNIFIGRRAGASPEQISSCIFIGNRAGLNERESNKLYIENSDSDSPLIFGDFEADQIQINGSLHVSEFARLIPQENAPAQPTVGTIYYDQLDNKLKVWTGNGWEDLN